MTSINKMIITPEQYLTCDGNDDVSFAHKASEFPGNLRDKTTITVLQVRK